MTPLAFDGPAVMRLSPKDNVAVALRALKAGEIVLLDGAALVIERNLAVGSKLAAQPITGGGLVVKYGCPIGTAIRAIAAGEHIHKDNVATSYLPTYTLPE